MVVSNKKTELPAGGDEFDFFGFYAELLLRLNSQLNRLPERLVVKVKTALDDLILLVKEKRPPRFMVIARRGAGKSSLINAIFEYYIRQTGAVQAVTGAAHWEIYRKGDKEMAVLDTRGIREGGKPIEYDLSLTPVESILKAVRESLPDAVLFLCKAKEVDAGINDDLEDVERILRAIEQFSGVKLPVLAIVSQCDELDPSDIRNLPTDDEEKNANINKAVEVLKRNILCRGYFQDNLLDVIPISAYARYNSDGSINRQRDYRWNINLLIELLLEVLPKQAKLDFARLAQVRKVQKEVARNVINGCAALCGAIGGITPVPAVDIPIIIGIQTTMIIIIAYISGREISYKAARELLAGLGIGQVGRIALREAVGFILDFIPLFGDVAAGLLDASATKAIGEAAIAYFLDDAPIELVKRMYDQAKQQ